MSEPSASAARGLDRDRRAADSTRRNSALQSQRESRDAAIEHASDHRRETTARRTSAAERARAEREVSLLEMIDRLLAGGVVIHGDITLAVADVDLLYVGLRALIASVDTVERDLVGPLDRPRST